MGIQKRVFLVGLLFSVVCTLNAYNKRNYHTRNRWSPNSSRQSDHVYPLQWVGRQLGSLVQDALELNYNLLSLDSVKIITGITAPYLLLRMADDRMQSTFYDPATHTNICQLPQSCHKVAKYGVGIPMVALSSLALFAHDPDLRLTGRMLAIGLPFVQSGKDIIKKLRFNCCLRPWHQDFSNKERSSGGFPSGHMANAVYMTTLFGMRHGFWWGMPLGMLSTFVFADFFNCNRHYPSQLVAGVGLGMLFAFAADKVISKRLQSMKDCFSICSDSNGMPAATFSYRF